MYSPSKQKLVKQNRSRGKIVFFLTIVVLLIVVIAGILEKTGVTDFYQKSQSKTPTEVAPQPTINLEPPTSEESKAGDQQKDQIVQQETKPPTPAMNAKVIIVDASQYDTSVEVRAFASNVIKNGTCTFTFTKSGESSIEKTEPAYADASSSPCIALTVDRSEFPSAGTWQLTVKYTSEGIEGSAESSLQLQ